MGTAAVRRVGTGEATRGRTSLRLLPSGPDRGWRALRPPPAPGFQYISDAGDRMSKAGNVGARRPGARKSAICWPISAICAPHPTAASDDTARLRRQPARPRPPFLGATRRGSRPGSPAIARGSCRCGGCTRWSPVPRVRRSLGSRPRSRRPISAMAGLASSSGSTATRRASPSTSRAPATTSGRRPWPIAAASARCARSAPWCRSRRPASSRRRGR